MTLIKGGKPTKRIKTIALITIAVLFMAGIAWMLTADRREPASKAEMHRHLLSQATDDQIRKLHEKAITRSAERAAERVQVLASQAQAQDIHSERCSDPAYRARNRTSCSASIMGLGIQMPSTSVDAVFDEMLLGICIYASSRHEAREMGCLP